MNFFSTFEQKIIVSKNLEIFLQKLSDIKELSLCPTHVVCLLIRLNAERFSNTLRRHIRLCNYNVISATENQNIIVRGEPTSLSQNSTQNNILVASIMAFKW